MSKSKIESLLNEKHVEKRTALEYVAVIESCERARYAPGSSVNIQDDFKKAIELITKIDREI